MTESYYFAARHHRVNELKLYREGLLARIPTAIVTSRWIDSGLIFPNAEDLATNPQMYGEVVKTEMEDMAAATVHVHFTGGTEVGAAVRHVEYGIGLMYLEYKLLMGSTRVVVIGPRENMYQCHPEVEVYSSWNQFLESEVRRTATRTI